MKKLNTINTKKYFNDDDDFSENSSKYNIESHGDQIWFYGGIDEESALKLNKSLHEISTRLAPLAFSSMQEITSPPPIYLHINSMGGEVFSSFAVADTIERISIITPVITIVEGCAASGATFISTAGSKKFMRKNAYMLIHELSDFIWGQYTDMKDNMYSNDAIMETIKKWYEEKTKIPKKQLDQILSQNIWWNAKDCLKYGLVDQII